MTSPQIRGPSPFRYPGGKQALIPYVAEFIRANDLDCPHLIEPFAGGAAVSLGLLRAGLVERITLVERDPLIYAFWKCVKHQPDALCERIWRLEVTLDTWHAYQPYRQAEPLGNFPLLDLAVAGIFFNRANFSGVIGAKPIGGMSQSSDYAIDCRWNAETLTTRICDIAKQRGLIQVAFGDAVDYLRSKAKSLLQRAAERQAIVYVDPPYYIQGHRLYRHHFDDAGHERLARYLNAQQWPWLVSYDNHARIYELFKGQKIVPFHLQYVVKEARLADELLITNQAQLPIPVVKLSRDRARQLRLELGNVASVSGR
jgi:DNA adenine methylase